MTPPTPAPEPPAQRFNHIAMSVPAALLQPDGRKEILEFYEDVFGWTEMPTMSEDGKRLVLRAHSNEQFVFLAADPNPMACPGLDHFGLSVREPEALYEILARARRFAERDDRVEIVDPQVEDYQVLELHSFYVRFLLPLMVEVQCFAWAAGAGPQSVPD